MLFQQIEGSKSTAMEGETSASNGSVFDKNNEIEAGRSSSSSATSAADKRAERMKRLRELHLRRVKPLFISVVTTKCGKAVQMT